MRFMLVHKNGLLWNVTTEDKLYEQYQHDFENFLTLFPARSFKATRWQRAPLPHNEAMILPAQVNYVGQAVNLFTSGNNTPSEYSTSIGSSLVGTRFLRTGPLWEKIRVMGGAYGAFCAFDYFTGVMTFVSYRDPNVLNTLDVFNKAGKFLATNNLPEEEVDKAVIGTIGDMDSYQLPDAKGFSSLIRYLTKMDDQKRQKIRDEILQTNSKDLQNFGLDIDQACQESFVSVMGNKVKIEQAIKDGLKIENVFSVL